MFNALIFLFLYLGFGTGVANAYLDPGTGSMLLQIILGGIAGLFVAGRLYWGKIKALFRRSVQKPSSKSSTKKS